MSNLWCRYTIQLSQKHSNVVRKIFHPVNARFEPTVALNLYSDDATVEDTCPPPSGDNNFKRSSASESRFTEAERPNRTYH